MPTRKKAKPKEAPAPTLFDPIAAPTLFPVEPPKHLSLTDRFVVPPFSVLDGRSGLWQERKEAWQGLGIRSELGRDDKLLDMSSLTTEEDKPCPTCEGSGTTPGKITPCKNCHGTGLKFGNRKAVHGSTSIFDPVLCELAYRWYCPPGGTVLDPYAGGSVRGLVAALLQRDYIGVDLRPEQIAANEDQAMAIFTDWPHEKGTPVWLEGDSRVLPRVIGGKPNTFDFVFTCPPYVDLEKYSNDPRDLSNLKGYAKFLDAYRDVVGHLAAYLKPDRFAAFVVGEVRQKDGSYYGLVPDTIRAFVDQGLSYYNEFILVTPLGTAPVRASAQFTAGRKTVKAHQNLLVFVKGDAKAAAEAVPLPGAAAAEDIEAWVDTRDVSLG